MVSDVNHIYFSQPYLYLEIVNDCLMKFKCNIKMKNNYFEKNASYKLKEFLKSDFTKPLN